PCMNARGAAGSGPTAMTRTWPASPCCWKAPPNPPSRTASRTSATSMSCWQPCSGPPTGHSPQRHRPTSCPGHDLPGRRSRGSSQAALPWSAADAGALLGGDHEVAFHAGHSGGGGSGGGGSVCLGQRVDVPVELGGVIGHLDPHVARVHLRLAPEGFLDLGLDLGGADPRLDHDDVSDPHHPAHVADHPLDLPPLVVPLDLTVERHPAGLHPGAHLALRDPG